MTKRQKHRATIEAIGKGWRATCSCGFSGAIETTKSAATETAGIHRYCEARASR